MSESQQALVEHRPPIKEIIIVEQLPIIRQQLELMRDCIKADVAAALALLVTDETVKEVKAVRARLRGDFNTLEKVRIEVKKKILTPYEQFEAFYRECITDIYGPADAQLKSKIDEVENSLKEQRRVEAEAFFNEYAASKNIDFVTFARSGISVTLSVSKKALKDQSRVFIDKIADELALIDTQEYKAEILVEYKKTLNVAASITMVVERMKAIEAERDRVVATQKATNERAAAVQHIDTIVEAERATTPVAALSPPVVESGPVAEASAEAEVTTKLYEVTFSVTGTIEQLKVLKQFLIDGGYLYVNK